jgi:hypothetical protein
VTVRFGRIADATDWIANFFAAQPGVGRDWRIATPLGLGKPNLLLNDLYARAKADPALKLTLFTALSLNPPRATGIGARFLAPFAVQQWGADYPVLAYAEDGAREALPPNVTVHEFYLQAGAMLQAPRMQRDYVSVNYTHVAEVVREMGVRVIVQLVAKRGDKYSLSCNPDLTLDLAGGENAPLVVGVVHPDLPFMGGDAEVGEEFFSGIVESDETHHQLFALPRSPIEDAEHWIGLHVSGLIRDGGTLQVGIGSLSDGVVAALLLRHQRNALYQRMGGAGGAFEHGLYGLSEMVTDAFMHLRRAGILKREVVGEHSRTFLHGAFFLGSKEFYAWLRDMPEEEARGVRMTRVSKVNDLYDPNEALLRQQRKHPRFLNTCMQATLLGGAASDTLPDGRVVSGVGGQYNFVAMAHELRDSRSILMLRAVREKAGKRSSNIVWGHGQLTIPRHLRDIVVSEYGVADIRGKSDEQCVRAMIAIADSEFQPELAAIAKRYGKLARDYVLPAPVNTPARLREEAARFRGEGAFQPFPLGSDFTPVEERLAVALGALEKSSTLGQLRYAWHGLRAPSFAAELARLGISHGVSVAAVRGALAEALCVFSQ